MQRFERTLAAGEWFQLPAGTQFFIYSLIGAETISARFVAPDGKQIANKMQLPSGFRYGNGLPREDGSDWFQYVQIKNDNADLVSVVIYVAGVGMDLSGVASAVAVTGTVFSDVRGGALAASNDTSSNDDKSTDFYLRLKEWTVEPGGRETVKIFASDRPQNVNTFPKKIFVERVDFWADGGALGLEVEPFITDQVSTGGGVKLDINSNFGVFAGDQPDMLPRDATYDTSWAKYQASALAASNVYDVSASKDGEVMSWVPPVPLFIGRAVTHNVSREYFESKISLINRTGAQITGANMIIYGRAVMQ
tara:strand:- start:98435 stop:99355 length:921 start_codon:yes stop_codon:yes gene_type:complete